MKAPPVIRKRNAAVIGTIRALLARGEAAGVFLRGVDPLDLHLLITASGFTGCRTGTRWGAIFGQNLHSRPRAAKHRRMIAEAVLRYMAP